MRSIKICSYGFSLLLACVSCCVSCSGGGANGEGAKHSKSKVVQDILASAQIVPTTLNGSPCGVASSRLNFFQSSGALNNHGEVLLNCGTEAQPQYALWTGGDTLKPIPAPVSDPLYEMFALADDGTIIGNSYADLSGSPLSGFVDPVINGFTVKDGEVHLFPTHVQAISRNGRYVTTISKFDENTTALEEFLYEDLKPVELSPLPPTTVVGPAFSVTNDGVTAGVAGFDGGSNQSFTVNYGYLRSQDRLDLIPPPGRPEFAMASQLSINNKGGAVLVYYSGVSPSDGSGGTVPYAHAELVLPDLSTVQITSGNIQTTYAAINDNNIVIGNYVDLNPGTSNGQGSDFIYSPKSGLQTVAQAFPGTNISYIAEINDKNQMLVGIPSPTAEDEFHTTLELVQLPADF